MATDGDIYQKLEEYKKALKAGNFDTARNRYQEIENLIKSSDISEGYKLFFKVIFLKTTEAIILNPDYKTITKGQNLFQIDIPIINDYLEFYWSIIDEKLLSTISESSISKMNATADAIISAMGGGFKLHSESEINSTTHIQEDGTIATAEYRACIVAINTAIRNGKEQLETIIPLFSIWRGKGKNIDKELKEIRKEVKELKTEKLVDFEAEYFKKTADKHRIRCILFLIGAFVLGLLTIIWALGIKEIWGVKNFLISQNIECSQYTQPDFYLCKLSTFPKELLVGVVLVAGIVACLRAYFANAHSESISRHRFNSLQIYSKGRNLIDDRDRDVFVQKATEAVFEQLPTGFTKYHKDDSNKSSDNNAQLALINALATRATKGTNPPSA